MRHPFLYMSWNNVNAKKDNTKNLEQLQHDALRDANVNQGQDIDDSFLSMWLNPGRRQEQEFGQQVALQQMQNEWNSEGEKMHRMVEAGINPNLAAAGVAGSGVAPSVGSPNSAVGSGASGVGAAAQGVHSLASASDVYGQNVERFGMLPLNARFRVAETEKVISEALHNKWLARSISTLLPFQSGNVQADTFLKIANFKNAKEEYHNILIEHDKRKAEIDEIQKRAALAEKQGNLVDAQALKVKADTLNVELQNWFKQSDKEFRQAHGYDRNQPFDYALLSALGDGSEEMIEALGDAIYFYHYNINAADVDTSFDKAWNIEAAKSEFAPYLASIEVQKEALKEFAKETLENPDNIQHAIGMFFKRIVRSIDEPSYSKKTKDVRNAPNPAYNED